MFVFSNDEKLKKAFPHDVVKIPLKNGKEYLGLVIKETINHNALDAIFDGTWTYNSKVTILTIDKKKVDIDIAEIDLEKVEKLPDKNEEMKKILEEIGLKKQSA